MKLLCLYYTPKFNWLEDRRNFTIAVNCRKYCYIAIKSAVDRNSYYDYESIAAHEN